MSELPVYEIETVSDFLKVPDEHIEECLESFTASILAAHGFNQAVIAEAEAEGGECAGLKLRNFHFTPDGKRETKIELKLPGEDAEA